MEEEKERGIKGRMIIFIIRVIEIPRWNRRY